MFSPKDGIRHILSNSLQSQILMRFISLAIRPLRVEMIMKFFRMNEQLVILLHRLMIRRSNVPSFLCKKIRFGEFGVLRPGVVSCDYAEFSSLQVLLCTQDVYLHCYKIFDDYVQSIERHLNYLDDVILDGHGLCLEDQTAKRNSLFWGGHL
mmetsp:Transcript_19626/g.24924  ORF Transcript_19626/g.24924 Transcript_19626/m.24924 type:complete len:152 (-) Transcript_19626:57-512(-)